MDDSTADSEYARTLGEKRAEKDDFFATHRQSPIPPEKRDDFDGLAYFEPDTAYRVEANVTRFDDPETVELDTSDGRTVTYKRVFEFAVEMRGEAQTLAGYRQQPDDAIFVPFRDKTTGQQTYKDGRYLELEPEGDIADGDTVELDFNLAYSPFCAYSETFACPLPPEENWLDVVVPAGEKKPSL
ncbi:hypothetical protein SAMN05216226_10163 [Halovenus aranensis]|uniref:DUF1684 domain-containing protein n=1 Tax=Halovenus aranensis TaxID=890420 RepID=A0A1G8RQU4_9EURY|nr:DUF1684 domain-containing protein [Halovenus aranensis]SDJ19316.1 hypothetical protein SAMN05216226_10163 [Halovenus aranensis]